MGQESWSGSTMLENLKMLVLKGRIFQVIFQRRCLSLCWIFKPHKMFQSTGERGQKERFGEGVSMPWVDLTVKFPRREGVQISLSMEGERGRWMSRILVAEIGSNKLWMRGEFQHLRWEEIRLSDGFGDGLNPAKVRTQGVDHMFRLRPREIDQQAPFPMTLLHFRISFQSQEALGGILAWRKFELMRYLDFRVETQRRLLFVKMFHSSLASKDLF